MYLYHKTLADGFFMFAVMAVFAAMIGWSVSDIWLASTQWILVAIVLLLIAIYIKLSAHEDEILLKECHERKKNEKNTKHASFRLTK